MSSAHVKMVIAAISQKGVDYHRRDGGVCPLCKRKNCKVTRTMPWAEGTRERYHKCSCEFTFKSIEAVINDGAA